MIQTYANIYDLVPTEPLFDVTPDNVEGRSERWTIQELRDSIREEGIRYPLKVDDEGNIRNGNGRYWSARWLLIMENDGRFLYLPVVPHEIIGSYIIELNRDPISADEIKAVSNKIINSQFDVTPSKTEFEDYELDPDNPRRLKGADFGMVFDGNTIRTKDGDIRLVLMKMDKKEGVISDGLPRYQ